MVLTLVVPSLCSGNSGKRVGSGTRNRNNGSVPVIAARPHTIMHVCQICVELESMVENIIPHSTDPKILPTFEFDDQIENISPRPFFPN